MGWFKDFFGRHEDEVKPKVKPFVEFPFKKFYAQIDKFKANVQSLEQRELRYFKHFNQHVNDIQMGLTMIASDIHMGKIKTYNDKRRVQEELRRIALDLKDLSQRQFPYSKQELASAIEKYEGYKAEMEKDMSDLLKALKVVMNRQSDEQAESYENMKGLIGSFREKLRQPVNL